MSKLNELIKKYDCAGPRYTSYPPVPMWENSPTESLWFEHVKNSFLERPKVDLYLHIPFCQSICSYCGCNRILAPGENIVDNYLAALVKEWSFYQSKTGELTISSIHMGGGTPTYLSDKQLERLLGSIIGSSNSRNVLGSFEADPRVTTDSQLKILTKFGLDRISLGVQDFDDNVQEIIGRRQSYKMVSTLVDLAHKNGFREINFDLIFGLPGQTKQSIKETFAKVSKLLPDTIAFYSYAHVPNFASNQKILEKWTIPEGVEKRELYELGRDLLFDLGYIELGMDHFARESSSLFKAYKDKSLSRSFMGYTIRTAPVLIGMGASSISSSKYSYIQNEKSVSKYINKIECGQLPIIKGHVKTEEDIKVGKIIHDIMCIGETSKVLAQGYDLEGFFNDGLLEMTDDKLIISQLGRPFLRNISMAFDHRLESKKTTFSRTI